MVSVLSNLIKYNKYVVAYQEYEELQRFEVSCVENVSFAGWLVSLFTGNTTECYIWLHLNNLKCDYVIQKTLFYWLIILYQ